ncbi:hypothetical protein M4951_25165 [Blastopirellula sp. J2-11]|uniref:hypothetical protein n=1 Tax=Blastopirellula sp. J2-11 TaxID=2943192 RepID=UPI0021CA08C4|nr:hypothetical protein [Blastopirellula sp. J2-11]UUO06621.1 hypothetical protein M4951_25165 [Blastopirellula sp. J2-11]
MTHSPHIVILDLQGHKSPLFEWLRTSDWSWSVVEQFFTDDWQPPAGTSLIVTAQHYEQPFVSVLARLLKQDAIPVLILADGILEYRNTWLHPSIAPGAIFQPVFGHKIACIGRSQSRVLESWGNVGKCEVVGSPRFDSLSGQKRRTRSADQPFTILIMTAKTPGFTEDQIQNVQDGLADLKNWLSQQTDVQPVWRLTGGLDQKLGLMPSESNLQTVPIAEVMKQVDAVITTPSTAQLEAMYCGLPVALLDYGNFPHYVPAAWTISASHQIASVMSELANPPAARMLFQDVSLHDALECRTPATPRMLELAKQLIEKGTQRAAAGKPVGQIEQILPLDGRAPQVREERFVMADLYPEHPFFAETDRERLQVEIGHLKHQLQKVSQDLTACKEQMQKQSNGRPPRIKRLWKSLSKRIKRVFAGG